MQSLRIFIVHPSEMLTDYLPNGASWIVFNYLKGLTERGHTVHVAVPRVELRGPVPPGMHLHLLKEGQRKGASGRLRYMLAVRKLFTRLSASTEFDIAQQFTPVNTGLSLALLGKGVPLVLGPYSGHWAPEAFRRHKRPGLLSKFQVLVRDSVATLQQRQAGALIVTCPAARERVLSPKLREARLHIISHGIHGCEYPERLRVPTRPSILFLANLEYRKGIFTLLDAFDNFAEAVPECILEVWGDGEEVEGVRRRVAQSPFRERINLNGRASRDDIAEIMRAHSVYCMPSYGEPFGMTILEAMASGVPVVTTNVGGPAYLIHEEGGRTVPMHDAASLADALKEIVTSPDLQRSMGAYNRERIEQEFNWSRSLDRMEGVYQRILSKGDAPSLRSASQHLRA